MLWWGNPKIGRHFIAGLVSYSVLEIQHLLIKKFEDHEKKLSEMLRRKRPTRYCGNNTITIEQNWCPKMQKCGKVDTDANLCIHPETRLEYFNAPTKLSDELKPFLRT